MKAFAVYRRVAQRPVVLGIIASILAAIAYGFSQFLARQLVTGQVPSLVVATFGLLTGMLVLGALSVRGLVQDRRAPRRAFLLTALAGLCASAGVALSYSALSMAPVVVVAPVTAINPLVSLGLAHLFLQRLERITARIWAGAGLVVVGVVLVTLGTA